MHMGAELAFGGYIISYADEFVHRRSTTARVVNSMFWGGLVVGRLIAIPLSTRLSARAMLQIDLVGAGGIPRPDRIPARLVPRPVDRHHRVRRWRSPR